MSIEQKAEFGQYYEQYQPEIYRYFYIHTTNIWHSEDLTSEVFLRGFRAIERFKPTGIPIKIWFYTIAHHVLINYYKGIKPESLDNPLSREELLMDRNETQNPVLVTETHILATKVREAVENLSPYQKQIIRMHYLEEMEYEEISQLLGKSKGSIRITVFRAIGKLKEKLKDEN